MPKFPSDRVALLRLILSTNNNKFWTPFSKKNPILMALKGIQTVKEGNLSGETHIFIALPLRQSVSN